MAISGFEIVFGLVAINLIAFIGLQIDGFFVAKQPITPEHRALLRDVIIQHPTIVAEVTGFMTATTQMDFLEILAFAITQPHIANVPLKKLSPKWAFRFLLVVFWRHLYTGQPVTKG